MDYGIKDRTYETDGSQKKVIFFGNALPRLPAVYVLYFHGKRIYIGSTESLRKRIFSHHVLLSGKSMCGGGTPKMNFMYLKYKLCEKYGYWLMLEAALIRRLKPKMNNGF